MGDRTRVYVTRPLDAAARSNEPFDELARLVALPDERVVDDANVKKDASELVGLDTSDEPSESGSVLRACVAPRTSRTISDELLTLHILTMK